MINDKRNNIIGLLLCAAVFFLIAGTSGLAHGQAPFTDSIVKPYRGKKATRPLPRGANISSIYHQGNLFVTAKLDIEKLLQEDADQSEGYPLRTGVVQDFEPKTGKDGRWTELEDGGWLWTIAFHAPDAVGIRLRIRPWPPQAGAELIIYDAYSTNYSFGPFTSSLKKQSGEFWTPIVYSDEVRVEYYLPPGIDNLTPESQITIDALMNQYRHLPGLTPGKETVLPRSHELPCHLDVTCFSFWADAAAGVGALTYISNADHGQFFCSGGMLTRAVQDFTPLFQTARHCGVDTPAKADSVLVTWFYETNTCDGTIPDPTTLPQTSGAVLLADVSSSDYTLLGLESDVPGGVRFLGWDAAYWADGSFAAGIHHPKDSHKRISIGSKTGDAPCASGSGWEIIYPQGNGLTEPGSSGSPVFDSDHRVRGTLSGCGAIACNIDNRAVYGRFDVAWPALQPFLFPTDPLNIYIDTSFTGTELGTIPNPFRTVLKGTFAVARGHNVHIEQGTYNEQFTIDKAMTLYSRNGTVVIGE